MDKTTLIALVSILGSVITIIVSGAVTLITKLIDNRQKIEEHKLSVRSVYVNKKIQIAEDYIGRNNLRINYFKLQHQFLEDLKKNKRVKSDLLNNCMFLKEELHKIDFGKSVNSALFFDLDDDVRKLSILFNTLNEYIDNIYKITYDLSTNFDDPRLDNQIALYLENSTEVIEILRSMGVKVRNNLAKYDLV